MNECPFTFFCCCVHGHVKPCPQIVGNCTNYKECGVYNVAMVKLLKLEVEDKDDKSH